MDLGSLISTKIELRVNDGASVTAGKLVETLTGQPGVV